MPTNKRTLSEVQTEDNEVETSDSKSACKAPRQDMLSASDVVAQINETKFRVKEKEEVLRKLKLVRMYRTKWETQDLESVTVQWLRVSQEALEDLRIKVREKLVPENGQNLTLMSLIQSLGLDPELLELVETEDCFLDQ